MSPDLASALLQELRALRDDMGEVRSDISAVRALQAVHNVQLAEHMRRTELAEKQLEAHNARIKPLELYVSGWAGVRQLVTVLAAVAATAAALATIAKYLF